MTTHVQRKLFKRYCNVHAKTCGWTRVVFFIYDIGCTISRVLVWLEIYIPFQCTSYVVRVILLFK